jgi:Icc-related predicted phosphoesterase
MGVKVAALYDVHGNLPALDAVLAEMHEEGVDIVVFGGDLVWGRGRARHSIVRRGSAHAHDSCAATGRRWC